MTFTADRQNTYACFLTPYDWTEGLIKTYKNRCAEMGYPAPTPDKFAYLALVYVSDSEEDAQSYGQELLWYLYRERHPQLNAPPGYLPPQIQANIVLGKMGKAYRDSFEQLQEKGIVIAGTPDQVLEKVKYLHERCSIGHLLMMSHAGFMSAEKTRRSLELFAKEVYPAIKDLGETPSQQREVAAVA